MIKQSSLDQFCLVRITAEYQEKECSGTDYVQHHIPVIHLRSVSSILYQFECVKLIHVYIIYIHTHIQCHGPVAFRSGVAGWRAEGGGGVLVSASSSFSSSSVDPRNWGLELGRSLHQVGSSHPLQGSLAGRETAADKGSLQALAHCLSIGDGVGGHRWRGR